MVTNFATIILLTDGGD